MINTRGSTPFAPVDWKSGEKPADMNNMQTPSSDEILSTFIPSSFKDKIWITHINKEEDWDKYEAHIVLEDGHWFAVVDDKIYCSLGKPYIHLPYQNVTKYLILQSPYSAVCGAYATIFCVDGLTSHDPMSLLSDGTRFIISNSKDYQYDVYNADIPQRNNNDIYAAGIYNRLR